MRVLLILGHPRSESFGASLADAFADGTREAGVDLEVIHVGELQFDVDVRFSSPDQQPLEPHLTEVQRLLVWADHLVLVYPTWWGLYPARLKGLLDRVLVPGFAFRYRATGGHQPLLGGRTAELITTMDTPPWVYRWVLGSPGRRALGAATLGFCGIPVVRHTVYGPVIKSSVEQRRRWLAATHGLGRRLSAGAESLRQRSIRKVRASLAALRLQFYPMTWIAYSVGALLPETPIKPLQYWLGLLALFLLEAATVLCNELWDVATDVKNENAGPFTGGSRVLVDRRLRPSQLQAASRLLLLGFIALSGWLVLSPPRVDLPLAVAFGLLGVLAIGYTVPPLRLAYRTLGELDVSATHSMGVVLVGYMLQGGPWHNSAPWVLSLPLLLSVLPAIILSGIPDRDADRAAGKQTIAVRLGICGASDVAMTSAVAAGIIVVGLWLGGYGDGLYGPASSLAFTHALVLAWFVGRFRNATQAQRIDSLMVLALSFILWFGLLPLFSLLRTGS